MALETLDTPQDLAAVPENSKDGSEEDDQSEEVPRRVKMLSRERREPSRRGLSRHSSGNIGPGTLTREPNRVLRAQSMRIVRPVPTASSGPPDSSGGSSGLSRDMSTSTPSRRLTGSRPGGRMRGVSRAKSMADGPLTRSLARSDSGRGLPSRRQVGRTSSQRSLAHMASESSLRPYRGHDKVVNQSIQVGRPGLRRSPEDRSYSDLSSFSIGGTEHSLARQCADPIDDQSYRETNSIADHESCVSGDIADYSEFLPENDPNHIPYDGVSMAEGTLCTFDSVQLRRKQIMATNSNHSFDASSFSTFASGDMNLEGEFEDYVSETGYYDEFYLDTTHVVEEDDAENAENSDSDDEETIEGDASDNEEDVDEDDEDEEDED